MQELTLTVVGIDFPNADGSNRRFEIALCEPGHFQTRPLASLHRMMCSGETILMSIAEVAASLKARVPWEVAQKIFEDNDIPRGMGWDRTLEKLAVSDDFPDSGESDLIEAMREHVLAGEKLTRFYGISPEGLSTLRSAIAGLTISATSKFGAAYPLPVPDTEIAASVITKPALAAIDVNDDGTALVFASIRAQEVREPVEVSQEMEDVLSAYEQVVGIRHIKRQAMDVVWIPNEGSTVDVRIDFPKGMVLEQGAFAHEQVREQLALLVGQDHLSSPVDLFPIVDKLYRNTGDGTVVELAFGTSTASLKHEKMRRSSICLRTETYHVGGTTALTAPIEPYRISVQWEREHGSVRSRPELSLQGQFRMTHLVDTPLHEAVIRKCLDTGDYNFVRGRVESYMVPKEPSEAAVTDQ